MNYFRLGTIFRLALLLLIAASPANAWFFGKDHPSTSEIATFVQDAVPGYMTIEEIEIGSQETRQGIFEYSETRARVTLAPNGPLYRGAGYAEDNTSLIEMSTEAGHSVVVFALVQAKATGEGWDGHVVWDDAGAIAALGHIRDQFDDSALIKGSDEHVVHLAMLREKREAEAQAMRELEKSVSGEFEGMVSCGRSFYEISSLNIDATAGKGALVWRKVRLGEVAWKKAALTVERNRGSESFRAFDSDWNFGLHSQDSVVGFSGNSNCDYALYSKGEVPSEVQALRAGQKAMLDLLSQGPIRARGFGSRRDLKMQAEILEIHERGFQVKVDHTMRMNGGFGSPSNNWRSESTINVRFADAPAPVFVGGSVEGRGELLLNGRCGITALVTDDGALRLEEGSSFGCGTSLELLP